MGTHRNLDQFDARLALPDNREMRVTSEEDLRDALGALPLVKSGETVCLSRNRKSFIRATRRGDLWSAFTQRGAWWTLASFTAEMTTEYGVRQVRNSRAAGSLWKRIALMVTSPPSEYALSTAQVETIFAEYFVGRRFSIPQSGA